MEIVVRGIERVPESVVLESIGVRVGELLSQERLRADVAAIVATGWFADANVRVEPARDGVRVAFLIVENPEITEIVIEGNTAIPTADIQRALNLPAGQVLNIVRLRDGTRAIEKLYEERGYVLARVVDVGVTANGGTRLRLRISEGKVEAVEWKGLVKTRQFVVERNMLVRPGRVFNINELNRDLQRLVALELFENVQARPRPGSTPEAVIVEIELKEQRTQQARFGLGYSDRTGIVGLIEYTERNWQGRNQSITIRYERGLGERGGPNLLGPAPSNFLITFREPFLDARNTAMEIALYQSTATELEYMDSTLTSRFNIERLGSAITLSRPLDPQTTLTARLRSERAQLFSLPLDPTAAACSNPDDPACPRPLPSRFTPGRTVALTLVGLRDTRDSRLTPTKGDRLSLTLDGAIPVLGDFAFIKYAAEYTRYFPLGGSTVFVGRTILGLSQGDLPIQEQYFAGGPSTLRGAPYARLRGNSMVLLNLEVRTGLGFVARQLQNFTGAFYVDVGTAPISTSNIHLSAGIGIGVSTAVGPIRIDLAFGPEGRQTWLTIGHPF
ncbi:MAG: BamA/OMP85 family outer membrane protein [Armatimonadota bacterium]